VPFTGLPARRPSALPAPTDTFPPSRKGIPSSSILGFLTELTELLAKMRSSRPSTASRPPSPESLAASATRALPRNTLQNYCSDGVGASVTNYRRPAREPSREPLANPRCPRDVLARLIVLLCAGFAIIAFPQRGQACQRCVENMRFFGSRASDPPPPQEDQSPSGALVDEVLRRRIVVRGPLLWLLAVPLLGLAGAAVARGRSRACLRRDSDRARELVGTEPCLADEALEGRSVTLPGQLVVIGKRTERFEDGAPTAAATASPGRRLDRDLTSVNARAQRLELAQGPTRVRLDGPLEVLLGSTETAWRSAKVLRADIQDRLLAASLSAFDLLGGARVTLKSLRQGDHVRVSGVLRRVATPGEGSTYRRPATQWVLEGELETASGPAIAAAYEGPPARPRSKRPAAAGGLIGATVAVLILTVSGHLGLTSRSADWSRTNSAGSLTRYFDDLPGDDAPRIGLIEGVMAGTEELLRRNGGDGAAGATAGTEALLRRNEANRPDVAD